MCRESLSQTQIINKYPCSSYGSHYISACGEDRNYISEYNQYATYAHFIARSRVS